MTPTNIKRTLTNDAPSTTSSSNTANNNGDTSRMMHTSDPQLKSDTPGHRAAEAYVRPAPVAVAGDILHYTFDLKTCTFTLKLRTAKDASPDAPTELFLPEYHFPRDASVVEVSGGKWELSEGDDGDGIQRLRWWHGKDEQSIKVTGQVRRYNAAAGGKDGGEVGYYDQLNNSLANGCVVM